jgi:hypothetical protein
MRSLVRLLQLQDLPRRKKAREMVKTEAWRFCTDTSCPEDVSGINLLSLSHTLSVKVFAGMELYAIGSSGSFCPQRSEFWRMRVVDRGFTSATASSRLGS